MKKLWILLALLILAGCATNYKSIQHRNPLQIITGADEIIEVTTGVSDFGKNNRMQKKVRMNDIIFQEVKITNTSDQDIIVDYDDINLSINEARILPIKAIDVYYTAKLRVYPYLLWALLTLNLYGSECEGYEGCDDVTIIPIGIPIALGNLLVSSGGNTKMKQELGMMSFETGVIKPGETRKGLVYFELRNRSYTHILINYKMAGQSYQLKL